MTRNEVEEIKGHFDKVMGEFRQELRQELTGGLEGLGQQLRQEFTGGLESLGQKLRREFTEGLGGLRQELSGRIDTVAGELKGEIAEVRRHAGAVAEDLRSEIRAVAEGVALANERVSQVDLRVDSLTSEVRRGFAGVRAEIHRLHETDDEVLGRVEKLEQRGA